jgi:putative membrane protein
MKNIIRFLLNAAGIFAIGYYLPQVTVDSFTTAVIIALVLAIVNTFLRPVLKLLTFPINLMTLGLFGWIINAFLVWLTAFIVPGFEIEGLLYYFVFAFLISVVSTIIGWVM